MKWKCDHSSFDSEEGFRSGEWKLDMGDMSVILESEGNDSWKWYLVADQFARTRIPQFRNSFRHIFRKGADVKTYLVHAQVRAFEEFVIELEKFHSELLKENIEHG